MLLLSFISVLKCCNPHFALHTATDQWPMEPVAISNPFLAIYSFLSPVCANSYYLHETSSPFLFCCAPTMNPLGPYTLQEERLWEQGWYISNQSALSPWSISVVTPTLEPHCQPANQAEPANRKITRESCNRAKPGRGDSDTRQSQSQWTLIINNHLQIESRHRTRCLESSSIDPDNPETQTSR